MLASGFPPSMKSSISSENPMSDAVQLTCPWPCLSQHQSYFSCPWMQKCFFDFFDLYR